MARDADDVDSLKVTRCFANCQLTRHDFVLAFNSNVTSVFNRSWDITPSLHIHTPPLFQVELEKRLGIGGRASVAGCPEHWTIQT